MSANAGMFLTAGAAATSFVAQNTNARATDVQSVYEARLFEHNANIADLQRADALTRGRMLAGRHRNQVRSLVGAQRGAISESGVAVDDGTALDLTLESVFLGEIDADRIAADAAREALGFKLQANDYRRQSQLTRLAGRNSARAQRGAAFGTLLTGAAATYDIYDRSR